MTENRRRSNLILIAIALLAAAALTVNYFYRQQLQKAPASPSSIAGSMIGQHRPDFRLPDTLGLMRRIDEWDGQVVVLNFWATWCKPCVREIPAFVDLQDRYGRQGVQFLGLALDNPRDVTTFLDKLGVTVNYPILIGEDDAGIDIARDYGNGFGVLPYTVVIDRDGRIRFVQFGELLRGQAEQVLLQLVQ